ncbi:MAG TPA: hypothetical protein PKL15_04645 [Saprospiraceae bacterium]|nr:hypothetical protein [Saprospiraceae bacterium]HNM24692.1 hypothetical protein [Saprospiraceae bacterium]
MIKSLLQPAKRSIGKTLVAGFAVLAFVLLGSVQMSAQNYVPADQADVILKDKINTVYAQLLNETPGTSNYNLYFSKINYWSAIRTALGQNPDVGNAITVSATSICYPTNVADCQPQTKATMQSVINETKGYLIQ